MEYRSSARSFLTVPSRSSPTISARVFRPTLLPYHVSRFPIALHAARGTPYPRGSAFETQFKRRPPLRLQPPLEIPHANLCSTPGCPTTTGLKLIGSRQSKL